MSSTESPSQQTQASQSDDRPARKQTSGQTSGQTSKQTSGQTSKRTSSPSGSSGQGQGQRRSSGGGGAAKPRQIAAHAAQALQELTGKDPESVTALQRTDDGWTVQLEVVESRRIPDSADIMAVYEVDTDTSGELTGYRRRRRYNRGHTGEE